MISAVCLLLLLCRSGSSLPSPLPVSNAADGSLALLPEGELECGTRALWLFGLVRARGGAVSSDGRYYIYICVGGVLMLAAVGAAVARVSVSDLE